VLSGSACDAGGLPLCPIDTVFVAPGGNGAGTLDDPFGVIQTAIDLAGGVTDVVGTVTVVVAPGSYTESLEFQPDVQLRGAGPGQTLLFPTGAQVQALGAAVVGAEDSGIAGVTLFLPPTTDAAILADNVAFDVSDVEIDGTFAPAAVGIRLTGTGAKNGEDGPVSLVQDCRIHDVAVGIELDGAAAGIGFNVFDTITGAAAVRLTSTPGTAAALGDENDLVRTGSNVFENIAGVYVQNASGQPLLARANYWNNLPLPSQIAALVTGGVDVALPLFTLDSAKGVGIAATLVATVTDDATSNPLSGVQVTLVPAATSALPPSGVPGVYTASALPLGRYTVRARKTGYADQALLLNVGEGINEVEFRLGGTPSGGGSSPPTLHTGDWNGNRKLDLTEVLRVIQLYNSTSFSCGSGEDGYQIGPAGGTQCQPHGADYQGGAPDWRIRLTELLRVIQFLNAGGYYRCVSSPEDGYCASG